MIPILFLLLMQSPPVPVYEGARPTWLWQYPTNQGSVYFRMMTNGAKAFEWPTNAFNQVGLIDSRFVFSAKAPDQLKATPKISFTLRAVKGGIESMDSNAFDMAVETIKLKIVAPAPFKATFTADKGGQYKIEGQASIGAIWQLLGEATESPPLSGNFYFVDPEKRDGIFYRVFAP